MRSLNNARLPLRTVIRARASFLWTVKRARAYWVLPSTASPRRRTSWRLGQTASQASL